MVLRRFPAVATLAIGCSSTYREPVQDLAEPWLSDFAGERAPPCAEPIAYEETFAYGIVSVAWGDMDGDGDQDAAVGDYGAQVYRNVGGKLVPDVTLGGYGGTRVVDWADFDLDGDLDLAVGTENAYDYDEPVTIYENRDGDFVPVWNSPEHDSQTAVAWGDFDNDGYPDLAVANEGTCASCAGIKRDRVYRNNGGVSMSLVWTSPADEATWDVVWGDTDGDGDLDLVTGGSEARLWRNDSGSFTEVWSAPEVTRAEGLALEDYDGDGAVELALAHGDSTYVYENLAGNFSLDWVAATVNAQDVDWGDYDGDGDIDLVVAQGTYFAEEPLEVYENDGSGTLSLAWTSPTSFGGSSTELADLDGDGAEEIAIVDESDGWRVYNLADMDHDGDYDQCETLFALPIQPGIPGANSTFAVRGATPGATVHIALGTSLGVTPIPACGTAVAMSAPVVAGRAVADVNGFAAFEQAIPSGVAGLDVYYQAADVAACTVGDVQSQAF